MNTQDKVKLIELLDEYKAELAERNIKRVKDKWGGVPATRALYTHARIISTKLSVEVENELKSVWEA